MVGLSAQAEERYSLPSGRKDLETNTLAIGPYCITGLQGQALCLALSPLHLSLPFFLHTESQA